MKGKSLFQEIEELTSEYVRKGGKQSRKDRRALMLGFAEHAQASGANNIGQVGARHVIRYWKAHRALKDSTQRNHWYALCILWELAKKPEKPPKPRCLEWGMGASPHGDLKPLQSD